MKRFLLITLLLGCISCTGGEIQEEQDTYNPANADEFYSDEFFDMSEDPYYEEDITEPGD